MRESPLTHEFRCGACGTVITGIQRTTDTTLLKVMKLHADLCPGFPPASVTSDRAQAVAPDPGPSVSPRKDTPDGAETR